MGSPKAPAAPPHVCPVCELSFRTTHDCAGPCGPDSERTIRADHQADEAKDDAREAGR